MGATAAGDVGLGQHRQLARRQNHTALERGDYDLGRHESLVAQIAGDALR